MLGYKSDKICTRLQNSDEQNQRTRQKVSNKHMKRCSTTYVIRLMHIKTTMR